MKYNCESFCKNKTKTKIKQQLVFGSQNDSVSVHVCQTQLLMILPGTYEILQHRY